MFSWRASAPLIEVAADTNSPDPQIAIKDPTVLYHEGAWHLFATVRAKSGKVGIDYLSFTNWAQANQAPRYSLALHDQYYCAPQVFFFRPQKKWYMIYQFADKKRTPAFGPCFSTSDNLADPKSWSKPEPLVTNAPAKPKWLDFWVICDAQKAHLFYTSLDGHLWRREARLADFPNGWSEPVVAIQADLFEASHTYKLKGLDQFLTIVEAQGEGRRYYKAYVAKQLEGPWKGLADSLAMPFAAYSNIYQNPEWTTSVSHGELIRSGIDESLEIDPSDVRFLFQGTSDKGYQSPSYGAIPWRLGVLEMRR